MIPNKNETGRRLFQMLLLLVGGRVHYLLIKYQVKKKNFTHKTRLQNNNKKMQLQ